MPFTLLAKITVKPGNEAEFKSALGPLVEATRKEKGCIKYDPHQNPQKENEFWFVEEWEN